MQSAPGRHIQSLAQGILRGFLRGVLRAWVLVVPLVLALSLIRLGQIAYFWPTGYHVSTTDLASVVVQGFRFDLKVSAVAGFLLLLVLPWVSGKVQGRIAMGVSFLYVMLSLVNLHYFGFYKTPIDSLVFGLVEDDTQAVLQTIWRDFPVIWTLLLAALADLCVGCAAPHAGAASATRHRAPDPQRGAQAGAVHRGVLCVDLCRQGHPARDGVAAPAPHGHNVPVS
jgi:hypothetical protein